LHLQLRKTRLKNLDPASKKFLTLKTDYHKRHAYSEIRRMGKLEEVVTSALKSSNQPLTLVELAQKTGQPEKKVFKELRSLFEKGIITTENRRYRLL